MKDTLRGEQLKLSWPATPIRARAQSECKLVRATQFEPRIVNPERERSSNRLTMYSHNLGGPHSRAMTIEC
jgi:hypothetical protein